MRVEYKGYVIVQSEYNNHISVYYDNDLVLHLDTSEKYTEEELKQIVEIFMFDPEEL